MHSTNSERLNTKARAIKEALSRIGEPISEAQAKNIAAQEDCECKDGMFALAATRRQIFAGSGLVAAVGMTVMLPRAAGAKAPAGSVEYPVEDNSTKEQGRMMGVDGGYGSRSQFESEVRWTNPTKSAGFSPLQNSYGENPADFVGLVPNAPRFRTARRARSHRPLPSCGPVPWSNHLTGYSTEPAGALAPAARGSVAEIQPPRRRPEPRKSAGAVAASANVPILHSQSS